MKYLKNILLTAALFMNASFAANGGDNDNCHVTLGKTYSSQNNLPSAIVEFTAALDIPELIGSDRAICHANLAHAYYNLGDFVKAINHYTAALAIPELVGTARADCRVLLGYAYLEGEE